MSFLKRLFQPQPRQPRPIARPQRNYRTKLPTHSHRLLCQPLTDNQRPVVYYQIPLLREMLQWFGA